jgi:predicted Ser/Thr protein kinase
MIGFGWVEILILLACTGVFFLAPVVVAIVFFATARARNGESSGTRLPAPPVPVPNQVAYDASATSIDVVARLTQRFCPQCRTALAPDSPEGLCPACLMAGALGSNLESPEPGMAATTPPSGSQPPATGEWSDLAARFPQLEILELLGRGGMGTVYKARQRNLDRFIALKVIPPDAAADPAFAERFAREARAMARLNHPNIVTVYDFSHENDFYWLMMEYVDGVNLRHALRAGHLQPREALAIVPQVCDALQYAHDQGVVHRDIKPENVLLDRTGRVKIADFGLAKLLGKGPDDFTLTRTQQVMGTPRYMAPEQIERPTTVDHRADIYSLGVVLYEMLTGELPLGRFDPPSHKVQVDVRIDQVVLRALEKAPERRYQRASEIKTDLASSVNWAAPPAVATPVTRSAPTPPTWHTPSPASKDAPTEYPSFPGGVPLAKVLMVALGMVLGVLLIGAGPAMAVLALGGVLPDPGAWLVAALGCVAIGVGSATWSYNTYRQMAGAADLLRSPRVTWFDWVMRVYLVVGVALLILGSALAGGGNFKNAQITLTLGGIPAFQAGLFLILRLLMRRTATKGAALASGSEENGPAEPGYLRAVVWPTLALAGVFAILLADVHFAMPQHGSNTGLTPKEDVYRRWHEALLLAAVLVVPSCSMALAVWRTGGPRLQDAVGRWVVSFPFGHRAWLWTIAVLAGLSLVLPWFRLEVQPEAVVDLRYGEVFPSDGPAPGGISVTASHLRHEELGRLAAISTSGRYSLRGLQAGNTAAAACLVIFVAALSAFVLEPRHPARIGLLVASGAIALALVTMQLHQAANQRPDIVVDDTIEDGLFQFAISARGSRPTSIDPWRHAIAPAIVARPAFGALALLAACGLAIFVGATELGWGVAQASPGKAKVGMATVEPKPLDPVREQLRAKVAGPAIGLVLTGILGLSPLLLVILAVPAWTLRHASAPADRQLLGSADDFSLPPPSIVPIAMWQSPTTAAALQSAALIPPLLAQRQDGTMVLWAPIAMGVFVVSLAQSIALIVGGWQMRNLRSYGLAFVAAVLALFPCTFAWVIGLPMGIWAIVVLLDPEVKAGFDA